MYRWDIHCYADPGYRDYPHMGQVLTYYRELCGHTQEEFGTLVGVLGSTISEWEASGHDSVSHLRELAELLDIPCELLGLADVEPNNLSSVVSEYRVKGCWTPTQLAKALGVSRGLIYQMEDHGTSLDLLSRRRALQFLLNIPPALLGLDALHLASPQPLMEPVLPELASIRAAQQRLWSSYYVLHGQDELEAVSRSLIQPTGRSFMRLKGALDALPEKERSLYLEHLSLFYQAVANIMLATAGKSTVLRYSNHGVKLARFSHNSDALAVALNRRAAVLFELGQIEKAKSSVQESLLFARSREVITSSNAVAARVFQSLQAGREKILTPAASEGKIDTPSPKKSSGNALADSLHPVIDDPYNLELDANILVVCRGQVLVNMAQHAPNSSQLLRESVNLLKSAERSAPETPRRMLLIKLAQARAYLGLHEYEQAADLAVEGFQLMQQIKSVLYLPQFLAVSAK